MNEKRFFDPANFSWSVQNVLLPSADIGEAVAAALNQFIGEMDVDLASDGATQFKQDDPVRDSYKNIPLIAVNAACDEFGYEPFLLVDLRQVIRRQVDDDLNDENPAPVLALIEVLKSLAVACEQELRERGFVET